MNLDQLWQSLEGTPMSRPGMTRLAAGGPQGGRVYAAIEQPGAGRLLLLRVSRADVHDVTGQDGEGLELRWMTLGDEPAHAYLALASRSPAYRELFARVAQDIAEQVVNTSGGEAAVRTLTGRLRHWRAFLRARGSGGLGELALRGLFGELWFIRERLLPRAAPDRVLSAWTGPGGAAQDFRFGHLRLDVKTAASPEAPLEISSAEQLHVPPGQLLLLAHLVLDTGPGGESVPDLVASIRAAVSGDTRAATLFQERLLQVGYHDDDAARYGERRLTVVRSHLYEVAGDFPRLTPDLLPGGVSAVRYSIDPGRCLPFIRDPALALAGLGGAA